MWLSFYKINDREVVRAYHMSYEILCRIYKQYKIKYITYIIHQHYLCLIFGVDNKDKIIPRTLWSLNVNRYSKSLGMSKIFFLLRSVKRSETFVASNEPRSWSMKRFEAFVTPMCILYVERPNVIETIGASYGIITNYMWNDDNTTEYEKYIISYYKYKSSSFRRNDARTKLITFIQIYIYMRYFFFNHKKRITRSRKMQVVPYHSAALIVECRASSLTYMNRESARPAKMVKRGGTHVQF